MAALRILSNSGEAFADREEAGSCLADELAELSGRPVVVLGIPRGGVIVARQLARRLDGELDVVIARKLGAPGNPELAIGAISEEGICFVDQSSAWSTGVSAAYIEQAKAEALVHLRRRAELYRKILAKTPLAGKVVVVTDDGVATGSTMQAALWTARQDNPARLIAALPVGPRDTLERLQPCADEVICLRCPPLFDAVGRFYLHFNQTPDDELMKILTEEARMRGTR